MRVAIFFALAIAVVNGFARFAYALILPAMRDALGWDYSAAGWLNTANSLGYAVGGLSGMLLLARFRASSLFTWGLLGSVVFIALVGVTTNLPLMLLWRFFAGVGSAWTFACGGALVAARYSHDPKKAASAIAIFYAGGGLGISLSGLTVFPVLSGDMSWSTAWITLGSVGAALSILPVLAARGGDSSSAISKPSNDVFEWRNYIPIGTAYFLFGVGYIVYMTFVIAWLREMKLGVATATALWVIMGIAAMASGWVWRYPMSNWQPTRTYTLVTVVTAIGGVIPLLFRNELALVASVVLVGGSFFMAPAAMTAMSRKTLPQSLWAKAMNLFTMVFAIGQAIGPVVAGWIADTYSLNAAMLGGSLVLLVSAMLAWVQRFR